MTKLRRTRQRDLFSAMPWHQERGFTFLEVMVSLAILAASLVVLLTLQTRSVDSHAESRAMTEALMLARARMVETEAGGFPEPGREEGDFGETYPGYRWIREVTETGVDLLQKVSLTVMPPGTDNGPGTVRLETFLAKVPTINVASLPPPAGSGESQQTSPPGSQESQPPGGPGRLPFLPPPGTLPPQGVVPPAQSSSPLPWLTPPRQ